MGTIGVRGRVLLIGLVGDPGVSRWTLNAAGTKWFYLRDYNYNREGGPSGTLYSRDFPTGASETAIRGALVPGGSTGGVGAYQLLVDQTDTDRGLGLLVNVVAGRGSYRVMNNPAGSADDPANVTTILTDATGLPIYSPDLRFFYGVKTIDELVGTGDSWIFRADGTPACTLTGSLASSIFGYPFTFTSKLVFWMDGFDAATDSGDDWVANPDGCTDKRKFSSAIDFWFVDGDRGLLYSDDSDGQDVSLRYAPVKSGQLMTAAPLHFQIDRMYAVLPNFEGVVFSLSNQGVADGVYHLPLPPQPVP